MKKYWLMAGLALGLSACDTVMQAVETANKSGFPNVATELSEKDIISGLKEALSVATDTSVKRLSSVDGFFKDQALKILLPPESQAVLEKLNQLSVTKPLVDKTILALNRAAEDAAKSAAPIFKEAIVNMSFSDARSILKGSDSSATNYLRRTTYTSLSNAFLPKIKNSLSKDLVYGQSAESLYSNLVNTYNTASLGGTLFSKIENNSLSEHVTGKALQGLFVKVKAEEGEIRNNLSHRVSDILKRVFAK